MSADPTNHSSIAHFLTAHSADANVTASLVLAGFVPNLLALQNWAQVIYFLVILPPAIWHAGAWLWKDIIKPVWEWFNHPC